MKENSEAAVQKLQESEFTNTTLGHSNGLLKKEMEGLTQDLVKEKKMRYDHEVRWLESKDKLSELTVDNKRLIEDLETYKSTVRNFYFFIFLLIPNFF